VSDQNVALLSVEPSAQRQEIRLVAEAKSSAAMFDFLEALRAQSLRDVVLVSHQVQTKAAGTPLRFQARAAWEQP
jgi:Tfp pilus assembly protein PilN